MRSTTSATTVPTTLRTLRVQMPPSFAVHLAVPILRDFRRAAAEVEIDLVSYYGVGPPPSDVDVAVLYSKPTVTDMVTDLLWPVHLSVLCHPNIAARYADKSLAEFIAANELLHVRISDLPRHHLWTQFARHANLSAVNVERGLVFDNVMLAVQYALSGEGIALVDTYLYGDYIRTGPPGQALRKQPRRRLRLLPVHPSGRLERHRHRAVPFVADRAVRHRRGTGDQANLHLAVSNE